MHVNLRKQHIPWMMASARAALGPVLIAGAACSWNGFTLAGIVVGALVSDIYDGVLARAVALRYGGCPTLRFDGGYFLLSVHRRCSLD